MQQQADEKQLPWDSEKYTSGARQEIKKPLLFSNYAF